MGLRTALRLVQAAEELQGDSPDPMHRTAVGIRSPWGVGDLTRIVVADIFGTAAVPVTRGEAMAVPAMARARHLLTGTLAGAPLRAYRGAAELPDQPPWLYRTDGPTSPWHRMLWTVDDLLFSGWSLWAVARGADGAVLDAARVPTERWSFDDQGRVRYDDDVLDPSTVLLIPGPHEGLLTFAANTLRAARRLEDAVASRAANPVPVTELHDTDDAPLEAEEVDELLADWRAARSDPDGAVAYTPARIELRTHGDAAGDLLVQARNASAIDVARHAGIPAAMVDASNVNSTLTYETLQGRNLEFADYALALYAGAISARLSLDDVVPRGVRVALDLSQLTTPTPAPGGAPLED